MRLTIFLLTLFSYTALFAQDLGFTSFGAADPDEMYRLIPTYDGGFAATGYVSDLPYPKIAFIAKFDANGDTVWFRTVNYLISEYATSIRETADSGFVICGEGKYCVAANCGTDAFVVKTDKDGNVEWSKGYGNLLWDAGMDIIQTSDGGYAVVGETASAGAGAMDMFIVRTDAAGDTIWHRTIGDVGGEEATSVVQTTDGGFMIGGSHRPVSQSDPSYPALVRLDAGGTMLWAKTYTIGSHSSIKDVVPVSGGFLAVTNRDVLIKVDQNGNLLWAKMFPKYTNWVSQKMNGRIFTEQDGGILLTGKYKEPTQSDYDAVVIRLNASGVFEWGRTYGGNDHEWSSSAIRLADGRIAISGVTYSYGAGSADAMLIMADQDGSLPGCDNAISFADSNVTVTVTNFNPLVTTGLKQGYVGFITLDPAPAVTTQCTGLMSVEEEEVVSDLWWFSSGNHVIIRSGDQAIFSVECFDMTGKLTGNPVKNGNDYIIDMSHIPAGLILASVRTEKGIFTMKIPAPGQ